MNASLYEIARLVDGVLMGDGDTIISSLAPIDNLVEGAISFVDGADNLKLAEKSSVSAILVANHVTSDVKPVIQVSHPLKAFIQLMNHFYSSPKNSPQIHPTAIIAEDVVMGEQVNVGPYVVIESGVNIGDHSDLKSHVYVGKDVKIGAYTTLHSQVTVYEKCEIGSRVSIHASTVIGSDGFGYTFVDNHHLKVPHVGNVVIEDDVEIGANTVIDRATFGSTVIGAGTKIDNLVQVAHSVKLGKNNILCAFTGIAGSTTTGSNVIFAANVGVSDHVRIDDDVILGARAGVPPKKHLKQGNVYLGNPARPKDLAIEQVLSISCIPIMRKNFKKLSKQVEQLRQQLSQESE